MKSIQYTIRNIPTPVDRALRERAAEKQQSFNQTLLEALESAAGVSARDKVIEFDDLDWFIDSKLQKDTAFDDAQAWLEQLPKDLHL